MTVKDKLKAEIDQLDEQYLELLYKIVRQFPHDSGKTQESGTDEELQGTSEMHSSFLLSIAGMFDSGENNSSERVSEMVEDFIVQKHEQGTL